MNLDLTIRNILAFGDTHSEGCKGAMRHAKSVIQEADVGQCLIGTTSEEVAAAKWLLRVIGAMTKGLSA